MKKNIKFLVKKLEQDQYGTLKGGFSAIKGGFKTFQMSPDSTNGQCTNSTGCVSTTNQQACTNEQAC